MFSKDCYCQIFPYSEKANITVTMISVLRTHSLIVSLRPPLSLSSLLSLSLCLSTKRDKRIIDFFPVNFELRLFQIENMGVISFIHCIYFRVFIIQKPPNFRISNLHFVKTKMPLKTNMTNIYITFFIVLVPD